MRRVFLAILIGVAGTAFAIQQAPQGQPGKPADITGAKVAGYGRILIAGDALAVGAQPGISKSWRQTLEESLDKTGIAYQYVGRKDSRTLMRFPFHEGHVGWTSNDILDGKSGSVDGNLHLWMVNHKPDTVILFTGISDADSHPSRYLGMLGTIYRANPAARVVVGLIPPSVTTSKAQQDRDNLKRQGQIAAVETFKRMGYAADVADTVTGFDPQTMLQGSTPNDLGNRTLTTAFRAALKRVWGF